MGADTSSLKGTKTNQQFAWMSNFSPGYILKLKERFELASDDFTLDEAALQQYFKCKPHEIQILFDYFDMDGNGKIDAYELTCALAMLSQGTLEEKAELVFNLYDFDGNKFISEDELVILMTNVLGSMNAMKQLKPPTMTEVEAKAKQFFKSADTDGDKMITLKEFKAYVSKDKEILEVLLKSGVAQREDLGKDFGTGTSTVPDCDPDLENECNPKALSSTQRTQAKQNMKDGVHDPDDDGALFKSEEVGAGDEFMAVKPWKGVVDNSVPTKFKRSPTDGAIPDATLQLEHIHGYRCHDARNNLRYTATGEIVYHAAAVGIVLNQKTNRQKFFIQHNDDIHCLAIDPTGKFCATGQIGPKPQLLVWNNETMECVARIQGTLLKGIKNVAFSPDGSHLVASAFDDDHSIAIYKWNSTLKPGETLKPVASGKGTRANILSIGFNPTATEVIATCVKEVCFFTFAGGLLKCKKGTGWPANTAQAVMCQAYVGQTLYTGLFDGSIASWNGSAIKGKMKAHTEGCHALYPRQNGLISGGGDGLIIFWQAGPAGLTQTNQFDLKLPEIKSMMPKVRSVCENTTTGMVLVGTRGGEIVEFGGPKPLVHIRGHFEGELWGLATHPQRAEFITVGQDNVLAIWDIATRKQKRFGKLEQSGNVAALSSNGQLLAIGYINGAVHVLQPDNKFAMKANKKDRVKAISDIKFNPNDTLMAVAAHDSLIILYDVVQNFKPLRKMRGHSSTVAHMDFSLDGKTIMSNCTSYNILFFDTTSGKHMPSGASMFKDETWASWTCTLGWPVQGIFPPFADGSDINACDRSPDSTIIATADDFGTVKLFKYPSPVEKASYNQYIGHSSHVTNARFVKSSPYLITTGGEDKCIFQWKYLIDKESQRQSAQMASAAAVQDLSNIANDIYTPPPPKSVAAQQQAKKPVAAQNDQNDMFQQEDAGEGDERMAVLPFKGQVDASWPTGYKPPQDAGGIPQGSLKLKYAHGFRSFDTRGNLKYINQNEIAFTTAALGVVLNKGTNTQKFFNLHQDDVVSMSIHPSKDIIATGQMVGRPQVKGQKVVDIFVWRASTGELLAQLNNFHKSAVRKIEFSPAGDKLLTIGETDQHMAIYDWASKAILCKVPAQTDRVFDACWKSETEFATVGLKHVKFYTIQGINVTVDNGIYGAAGIKPFISCQFAFQEKTFLTGSPTGELAVWNGRSIGKVHKPHADALWQIINVQNNTMIMTGGNDQKIVFLDKTFTQKMLIDLTPMSQFPTGVRSLDYHEPTKQILVGTRGSEIIEVNGTNGQKVKTLIYGHFQGSQQAELWGCAVHPTEQVFASCGADKTIRLWKENQMILASDLFTNDLTALDWSSNGAFIVAGDRAGHIHLIDPKTLKALGTSPSALANQKNVWIEDVKVSPNNEMIAFGTHGGLSKIDFVKVLNNGKQLQKIASVNAGISSSLTHLDWSSDSQFLVFNSGAYELMWLDVNQKKVVNASSAKNIDWFTWTSLFGFPVQGIWPPFSDFTDVNSVCRSFSRTILASADDLGKVKLFKYPCTVERAQHSSFLGHSSHVTKVKFTANDQFLITTGGNDKTVLVWQTDFGMNQPGGGNEIDEEFVEEEKDYGDEAMMEMYYDDIEDLRVSMVDKARLQKIQTKEELRRQATQNREKKQLIEDEDDNPFQQEDVGGGDEWLANIPWKGQIREPTGFKRAPVNQRMAPKVNIELEWVHGYRTRDSRNNIGILSDQSIAYHAAAVGIVYDASTHSQRFFNNHNDDITAIAFSPDNRYIATGEIGAKPFIQIWDGITMQLKCTIKGKMTKGIQSLSFSPSGKTIAAVGVDPDHSVGVFNAETGTCLGFDKGDVAQILDIAMLNDTVFSTSGIKHYKQWTVGANLTATKGAFGKYDQRHGVCKYSGQSCLSGSITGELYVWSGRGIKQALKLHEKPIDAIHVTPNFVFTGGKDCKVNVLSAGGLTQLFAFTVNEQQWGSVCGKIRAIALNDAQNILYVGTLGSEIFQVPIEMTKKGVGQPKRLVQGHYSPSLKDNNEVWGLTTIPNGQYVTVSDDATLRVWDPATRTQISYINFSLAENGQPVPLDPQTGELSNGTKGRSVAISPDGKMCAIGFRDGSLRAYSVGAPKWQLVKTLQVSPTGKWIQDLKYSPDGKWLAVSSHDCKIYVFNAATLAQKAICKSSSSAVTHIDWSIDSKSLHSNDLSYELLYYTAETGAQDLGGSTNFRNETWATWSLPLGWPASGIWPPGADGSDVNAVDRSNNQTLLASADDFSKVKIFRYPCSEDESESVVGKGHSSHVTGVKFSQDDKRLFTTGGNDTCVFQWKINDTFA